MKQYFLIRFVPSALRKRWARPTEPSAALPPAGHTRARRVQFMPLQLGGQILPYLIDTGAQDRRRDPYE